MMMNRSNWLLHGLHLGLALVIPFLLLMLMSCKPLLEKAKEEKPNNGTQVSGEAIDLAFDKAVAGANFDSIRVGQKVAYITNRRLESEEATTVLGANEVEVLNRQDTDDTATFTLQITTSTRLNDGSFETKVTEEPLVLKKGSLTSMLDWRASADSFTVKLAAAEPVRTYHNLREFTQVVKPPKLVSQRPDCGGLNPCQMEVRYIQFDLVDTYPDGRTQKISLDYGFNIHTPFLPYGDGFDQLSGLMILNCGSTFVPVEGRTVYVRDCHSLEDFQK